MVLGGGEALGRWKRGEEAVGEGEGRGGGRMMRREPGKGLTVSQDMKSLGVRPPDVLTRVTEFIPQIVSYIQKIIDNGFAYEAQGSVYFDIRSFRLPAALPLLLAG